IVEHLTPHLTIGYTLSSRSGTMFHSIEHTSQFSNCGGNIMRHGEFAVDGTSGTAGTATNGEKTVQIVHRIACVVRAFGNQALLGITDLANTTGLPKST